jgi:integrase
MRPLEQTVDDRRFAVFTNLSRLQPRVSHAGDVLRLHSHGHRRWEPPYRQPRAAELRTASERHATFERLVFPKLGKRPIDEIRRSEINALLNKIEDERGTAMADHTLAYLRRVLNWHAAQSDDFRSPIVRGMARGAPNRRSRILDDDEVRAFWRGALAWEKAAEFGHPFPRMLRFTFLTATRRDEAAQMAWSEIDNDAYDVWLIPAARYKTKLDFEVPLSRGAGGFCMRLGASSSGLMSSRLMEISQSTISPIGKPNSTPSCSPNYARLRWSVAATMKGSRCLAGPFTT